MKCPLLTDKDYSQQLEKNLTAGDCLKDECAWWIGTNQSCAIKAIPQILGYLGHDLRDIKDKLPGALPL